LNYKLVSLSMSNPGKWWRATCLDDTKKTDKLKCREAVQNKKHAT
jgi:hypothetical protein